MKIFNEKKYKTLYPDSIVTKTKLFYRQTNNKLNLFLNRHFSYNNNLKYKFPIKKPHSPIHKNSIRRNSTPVQESPKSSKKNDIRSIINSLLHEKYVSYNFYDNTKGLSCSQLYRKKNNKKAFKQRIFNMKNNSLSDENLNIFSFDDNANTSKNIFKSNLSVYRNNIANKRHTTIVHENHKDTKFRDSFPLTKYKMLLNRINSSKNLSMHQTPNSTRYMSNMKNNSLKLDYDSLSDNNNSMKRNSRNKSGLSRKSINNNKSKNKIMINNISESYLSDLKLNISDIEFSESQRKFHQQICLHKLNSDIRKFEESNGLYTNEEEIRANLLSPTKFQRDLFIKDIKRASKYNDFFFKRYPFSIAKLLSAKNKQNKNKSPQSPHQNCCDNKSKKILFNIGILDKKAKITNNNIKKIDLKIRTKNMKRILDYVVPVEHKVEDIDEEFKDETINYQRNIGKFFIYKGNGVYSGHLSTILRGDKIVQQAIKFDNL